MILDVCVIVCVCLCACVCVCVSGRESVGACVCVELLGLPFCSQIGKGKLTLASLAHSAKFRNRLGTQRWDMSCND